MVHNRWGTYNVYGKEISTLNSSKRYQNSAWVSKTHKRRQMGKKKRHVSHLENCSWHKDITVPILFVICQFIQDLILNITRMPIRLIWYGVKWMTLHCFTFWRYCSLCYGSMIEYPLNWIDWMLFYHDCLIDDNLYFRAESYEFSFSWTGLMWCK